MNIHTLLPYVRATRTYGHTYVHAPVRNRIHGWQGIEGQIDGKTVVATYCGYGRSLQGGGHKFKAHLRYKATGKPVASKDIDRVQAWDDVRGVYA